MVDTIRMRVLPGVPGPLNSAVTDAIAAIAQAAFLTVSTQSGTTYTLVAGDAGKLIRFTNASPVTVTLPNNLVVGFNCVIRQCGAGQVAVVAASGATINTAISPTATLTQYANLSVVVETNVGGSAANYAVT